MNVLIKNQDVIFQKTFLLKANIFKEFFEADDEK